MSGDVFDLDAVVNENAGVPFRFSFAGDAYELPAHVDFLAVAAMSEGDLAGALRRMLGDDQWERIKASPAVLTAVQLQALFEGYTAHVGASMGELLASTSSSPSMGRPSKLTSNGTTKPA